MKPALSSHLPQQELLGWLVQAFGIGQQAHCIRPPLVLFPSSVWYMLIINKTWFISIDLAQR
jgi:hypothetical protein